MLEAIVVEKIGKRLIDTLEKVPSVKIKTLEREPRIPQAGQRPDLVIKLKAPTGPMTLVIEGKASGEPRMVRMAAQQLLSYLKRVPGGYGIFAAPYISDEGFKVGQEAGIGLIDLSGNCYLNFGQVYLEVRGRPNLFPKLRFPKSLFSPRSSRVIRVLLVQWGRDWSVQELAREAQVSLGLVSGIKRRLMDYEFVRGEGRTFTLMNPKPLLEKWSENYTYDKNKLSDFYSFDEPKMLETKIGDYCKRNSLLYAFSLFSGANRVAPFSRYNRAFVYVKDGTSLPQLTEALNLKPVSTGPTVTIMEPYDDGVFYGRQNIDDLWVASNVQLYLDLKNFKGRGQEAAEFLFKQKIEPQWREDQTTPSLK